MAREYKDSGIEWIGQIPKEWKVVRTKNVFSLGKELVGTNSSQSQLLSLTTKGIKEVSVGSTSGKVPTSYDTYQLVHKNNLVFCLFDLDCSAVFAGVSNYEGMISPAYKVVSMQEGYYPQFYGYWFDYIFDGRKYKYLSKNIRYSLTYDEFAALGIVAPHFGEQQKIADYLDKVCGEADEMIALQEKMIEELKAYKQSVITEAVTKGQNPNAPMRNSGIDWIGEIPEHWEAKKLKYIIDYIESGTSVNAGNVPAQTNEFGVLKTSAVSKYVFDATENKTVVSEEMDKVSCPVRKNTIIVSRMNTPELVGACGYVENDYNNIFLPDRLWQVHFVDTVYVKYIWYALRGSNIRNYYSSLSVGSSSSMQNISQSQFSNGSIPIPCDVDEQRAIVSYLDTKCSEIDSLIAIKQQKIAELKEYKKSVIYEYVTGKKEVV